MRKAGLRGASLAETSIKGSRMTQAFTAEVLHGLSLENCSLCTALPYGSGLHPPCSSSDLLSILGSNLKSVELFKRVSKGYLYHWRWVCPELAGTSGMLPVQRSGARWQLFEGKNTLGFQCRNKQMASSVPQHSQS